MMSNIFSNQHAYNPLLELTRTNYCGSSVAAMFPARQQLSIFSAHHNQPPLKPQEGSYWSDGLGRQVDINIDWRPGSVSGFLLAAVDMIFVIVPLV